MKQSVSPAVMAVIIVVAVALIGFIGYKAFASGGGSNGPRPAEAKDDRKFREQYQNYSQNRPRMPGNMTRPGGGPMGSGGQ